MKTKTTIYFFVLFLMSVHARSQETWTAAGGMHLFYDMSARTPYQMVWNKDHVYCHSPGAPNTWELLTPLGTAIQNTRGIVHLDDGPTPLQFVWTSGNVFCHSPGSALTWEVLTPGGVPIANTRGIKIFYDYVSPDMIPYEMIWTDGNVYCHSPGSPNCWEVLSPTSASLTGTLGIMNFGDGGAEPTQFIWNVDHVYAHSPGSPNCWEVLTPASSPITGTKGMISNSTEQVIWTDNTVFCHVSGSPNCLEVMNPVPAPISQTRAVLTYYDNSSGNLELILTADNVLLHGAGSAATDEITTPALSSIADPRGIVLGMDVPPDYYPLEWIWSATNVYLHARGSLATAEIMTPSNGPIQDVQGIFNYTTNTGPPNWYVDSYQLIWNPAHIYNHSAGSTQTQEILTPSSQPVAGTQGVSLFRDGLYGNPNVLIWTQDRLFCKSMGSLITWEILDSGGQPIPDVLGSITSYDYTDRSAHEFIQIPEKVLCHSPGSANTWELLTPDNQPVTTFAPLLVNKIFVSTFTEDSISATGSGITGISSAEAIAITGGPKSVMYIPANTGNPSDKTTVSYINPYPPEVTYPEMTGLIIGPGPIAGCQWKTDVVIYTGTSTQDVGSHKNDHEIKIYPNPSNCRCFTLEINGDEPGEISVGVIDKLGRAVLSERITVKPGKTVHYFTLDQGISKGLYFIQCRGDDLNISRKLIID